MEFEALRTFWLSQSHVKRKYPMILSYNKYLTNIFEDKNANLQVKEVELFKKWLIENPHLGKKQVSFDKFKTGKQSISLDIKNFLMGDEASNEKFWKDLWDLELIMFPGGKPDQPAIQSFFPTLGDNPLAVGVFDKILESEQTMALVNNAINSGGDMVDLASFLECQDFWNVVESMKQNFSNGTYTEKHMKSTISEVLNLLRQNMKPENEKQTNSVITMATETLSALEKGHPPDLSKIMSVLTTLSLQSGQKETASNSATT